MYTKLLGRLIGIYTLLSIVGSIILCIVLVPTLGFGGIIVGILCCVLNMAAVAVLGAFSELCDEVTSIRVSLDSLTEEKNQDEDQSDEEEEETLEDDIDE